MNDWDDAEKRVERAHELYDLGQWQAALDELKAAIEINPYNSSWHFNLGLTYDALDRYQDAITCYRQAHALYRSGGEPSGEADVLTGIGDIHHETGNPDAARAAWEQALEILRTLDHPDAAHLEEKLKAL